MTASEIHPSLARAASAASSDEMMLGVGALWNLVCRDEHGGSVDQLLRLADAFCATPGTTSPEPALTPAAAALASGFALVRGGSYLRALEQLDEATRSGEGLPPTPPSRTLAAVVAVWRSVAAAASGRLLDMEGELARARSEVDALDDDASSALRGLVNLGEALREYHVGSVQKGKLCLDASDRDFAHPPPLEDAPFISFRAESLLLRGKCLREMGSYSAAMRAIRASQVLRRVMGDRLGEARGSIECARMRRFEGRNDEAEFELQEARAILGDRGFVDWECRALDQMGDIERARNRPREALAYYNVARDRACHRHRENPLLVAHIENSLARWHEENGKPDEAVAILDRYRRTWEGTRAQGKYLYLLGSVHLAAGNLAEARRVLKQAIESLQEAGMLSYVALASNRLAGVCVERAEDVRDEGRAEEADRLFGEACEHWAEALRTARTEVDADSLVERLQANAPRIPASHLVPIIAKLRRELHRLETDPPRRRQSEHRMLTHYYMRIANAYLFGSSKASGSPPAYLEDFHRIVDTPVWYIDDFSLRPAHPELVDVVDLAEKCANQVAKKTGLPFSVRATGTCEPVRASRAYLGEALTALFRALRGLRVRSVGLRSQASGDDFALTFEALSPEDIVLGDEDYLCDSTRLTGSSPSEELGYALLSVFVFEVFLWAGVTEWEGKRISIERGGRSRSQDDEGRDS